MSTWTSDTGLPMGAWARRALAVCAVFGLSGCLGSETGALGFLSSGSEPKRDVVRTASLYDGNVVVRGPQGYCVDKRSLRSGKSRGFVMLASCEALSGVRGNDVEPLIMTVSALPRDVNAAKPSAQEVANSMAPTPVLASFEAEDVNLVQFASGGEQALPGGDPRYWRGVMVLNGHLVGLALYARQGSPHAGAEGRDMLVELARSTRATTPVRPLVTDASELVSATPAPSNPLGALLGGLFPDSG